jgi:hypothetical protein
MFYLGACFQKFAWRKNQQGVYCRREYFIEIQQNPEIIDPVFVKRSFSMTEYERFACFHEYAGL